MNGDRRPFIKPGHYQFLCLASLGMTCAGLYRQGFEIVTLLIAALGAWALVSARTRAPLVFLFAVALTQTLGSVRWRRGVFVLPQTNSFDPNEMLLAAGVFIYMGCCYRLIGLQTSIVPTDSRLTPPRPRRGKNQSDAPAIPLTRPPASLAPEEIAWFLLLTPLWLMAGQFFWDWLRQSGETFGLSAWFSRVSVLLWLVVVGLLVVGSLIAYVRRRNAESDLARMYLQEVAWNEDRRDYLRMGSWLGWWRRKREKKLGKNH